MATAFSNLPMPLTDPLIVLPKKNLKPGQTDPNMGKMNEVWIPWFNNFTSSIQGIAKQVATPVSLTAQTDSVALTPIPSGTLAQGLYRATFFMKVNVAAGVSSSITVSFAFTRNSQACTFQSSPFAGNTSDTVGTGTAMMYIDQATPISYSTLYASNPANAMEYELSILLESL